MNKVIAKTYQETVAEWFETAVLFTGMAVVFGLLIKAY